MFKKNQKGFTLIELLIVIAIIAILAAIAIPQFAAYRIRGFNSSAESDIRNWKTTEEAMNTSFFSYASSISGIIPPGGGAPAPGPCGMLQGPMSAASTAATGSYLQAPFYASRNPVRLVLGAIGIGVGNNVFMCADSAASPTDAMVADRAMLHSKHLEGDTTFVADMDSTALYWCKDANWAKVGLPGVPDAGIVTPGLLSVDDYAGGAVGCGGAPIGTWTAL